MPKSKSKSSARAARSGGLSVHPALGSPDPLLRMRLGSIDPVRLPDHHNQPTAATVLRSDYTINSDAAGHVVFGESYDLNAFTAAVTAGSTAAALAYQPTYQKTSFEGAARQARMVGMKIIVTYIGAELESAGYLSCGSKTDASDITSRTLDGIHVSNSLQVQAKQGMTVYNSFTTDPDFTDVGPGWMKGFYHNICFAASGLPLSKPVFRVRVYRFVEFYPKEGDLFEGELSSEPHNPAAMSVHGILSNIATSYLPSHDQMGHISGFIKSAANAAYHHVQPMAQQYVVNKARSYLTELGTAGATALLMA